jgi:hypothetical protein
MTIIARSRFHAHGRRERAAHDHLALVVQLHRQLRQRPRRGAAQHDAAAVAHHILDTFFAKRDGRPLPPPPTDFKLDYSDPLGRGRPAPSGDDPPEAQGPVGPVAN